MNQMLLLRNKAVEYSYMFECRCSLFYWTCQFRKNRGLLGCWKPTFQRPFCFHLQGWSLWL